MKNDEFFTMSDFLTLLRYKNELLTKRVNFIIFTSFAVYSLRKLIINRKDDLNV